ncbi:protein kinase domain-containing protein [Streptomyces griseosporeus]|uniref:protein kinase domain-containing protein n=1 Tax=Streptomyces griseosporeus TaxID=1910 RepID=UPI00167D11D2|nr:PQQ-binding-like beta-propeller repeat protein [Streptomyces griseosporeus]GHF91398.1 hypothetical protein GCM10018783_72850 [Streptomyces griseosporeus]
MQALRATDPRRIGPYEVLGRLGAGGMGEVYLAASRSGPRVAVKVVRAEHAEDRTFRARFRHEVRAAQTVGGTGTYTARVVDADTEAERPWMATEFVDGPNLRDAVLDGGPLPSDAVRALAGALGEALAAIHAKGMVHRDLKPSNILLAQDGPRVIDFGIVRALEATSLTRTGTVVGSVGYVSPEQIRNGGAVGPPSDVFSLGAVLAYASAGREPFGEGQDSVVLLRILTRDYDLTGVPDGIRALVEACFAEDPHKRPTPHGVVALVGHTSSSLRASLRPGWYGPAGAPPSAAPERWMPARDSGERLSGVEYVAPLTTTDTPPPATATPTAEPPPSPTPQPTPPEPSAPAPALQGPSAPAPAPDRHPPAPQHPAAAAAPAPAAADAPAAPAVVDAPAPPDPAVADASPSPVRPAPSPGTPRPPQAPEPSPADAPTPSGRPVPTSASAPEPDAPVTPPASASEPDAPQAPAPSGRPVPAPASAPEPDVPARSPATGPHPAAPHASAPHPAAPPVPAPSGRPAPAPASAPEPDVPAGSSATGSEPSAPQAPAPHPAAPQAPPSRQGAPVGSSASAAAAGGVSGSVAVDTPGPPTAVQPGRRRVLGLLAGGAVTAAAGAGGWWWVSRSDDKDRDHGYANSGGGAAGEPAVLRWQYDVGGLGGLTGPCAAVSPDGTTVYVGGVNGTLHAVTAAGAKRWSVRLGDETSTPVATAGGVFCLAWENDRGLRKLHALGADGTRRWERTLGDNGYDRPLLLDDHILVALGNTDAGGLRCVAADGSTRWTATTPAGPTDTPLVAGGVVYTGCYGDRLLALDASDGRRLWSVPGGIDVGGPVLVGTTLVADSGGVRNRHGFRSRDGKLLWEKEVSSGPLVAGDDALAVAVSGGTFEGIRAADGSTAWTYESPYRDRDPALTVAGGLVYVRARAELLALGVDGRLRWTVTVGRDAGEDVHAPLVGGRRLYIPSGTGIAAVDVTA